MTTLKLNGVEFQVVYVDPTIATAGDGSTAATALSNIPELSNNKLYLIRRCDDNELNYVDMPISNYDSTLLNVAFIGMPKSGQVLYNQIDQDTITAWGSDTGKYARIRCNRTSYCDYSSSSTSNYDAFTDSAVNCVIKSSYFNLFLANNCYFYRDSESGTASSNGSRLDYMFAFLNSSAGNISFDNCKFGYTQYNLEDNDYIENNNDVATDTTKYPQYKCKGYIFGSGIKYFSFTNCIVNHVDTPSNYYSSSAVYNYTTFAPGRVISVSGNDCSVNNLEYNVLYRDCNTGNNYYYWDSHTWQCIRLSFNNTFCKNVVVNRIFTNDGLCVVGSNRNLYVLGQRVECENFTANYKVMGGGSLASISEHNTGSNILNLALLDVFYTQSIKLNHINIDYSNTPFYAFAALYLKGTCRSTVGNPSWGVKNICIKFNENGTLAVLRHYDDVKTGPKIVTIDNDIYGLGSGSIGSVNGNSDYSNYSSSSNYDNKSNNAKSIMIDNVTIDAYKYSGYTLNLVRSYVRANYIKGKIYMGASTLDVDEIYNYDSSTTGVDAYSNCYLKCNKFIANLSHPGFNGAPQMYIQNNSLNSVYVYETNALLFDANPSLAQYTYEQNDSIVCPNYLKSGQYFSRNSNTFAQSWNITRTGSNAQGCFKIFNHYYQGGYPLSIGNTPYNGIQVTPASTGKKMLKVYIACKNFDATELRRLSDSIIIRVNCPESKVDLNDSEKTYFVDNTYSSFEWVEDTTSTWSGDTGLVKFMTEIPIEIKTLEKNVNVRIDFDFYSIVGYVYIDPDFKLVDLV